jgi:hypothetical protein
LGNVANFKTLVTAEYFADAPTTSTPVHWPVTAQLYVPNEWLMNSKRRTRACIPDAVHAHRKHDVALAVIDRARAWDVPFRLVLADARYGRIVAFIKGLAERHLLYYVAWIKCLACVTLRTLYGRRWPPYRNPTGKQDDHAKPIRLRWSSFGRYLPTSQLRNGRRLRGARAVAAPCANNSLLCACIEAQARKRGARTIRASTRALKVG